MSNHRPSRSAVLFAIMLAILLSSAATAADQPGFFQRLFGKKTEKSLNVAGGYRYERAGWICVHIEGEPRERGYQHGYLVAPELKEIQRVMRHVVKWDTGMEWDFFIRQAEKLYARRVDEEFIEEIKGIAEGARAAGTDISWQEVLAWNAHIELLGYWWPTQDQGKHYQAERQHCSAFIAAGTTVTQTGGPVMAHNTWFSFTFAQFLNVILDIQPARGHRMFMQAGPGLIHSLTDFAVTGAGIMLTETTIGGFKPHDPEGDPEFFRIRKAMQYGGTLDDYVAILLKKNNGGYANAWLLADVNTGEIMRFELGLKIHAVERTRGGFYVGFNGPIDPALRAIECGGISITDIRNSLGARRVRLTQLMRVNLGRIDAALGRQVLADHYDVYLKKDNASRRSIDGHAELDPMQFPGKDASPFTPSGSVDGKVIDAALARQMSFWARWGNSCGKPFEAAKFLAENPQFEQLDGFLIDRPTQEWTLFRAGEKPPAGAEVRRVKLSIP